MIDSEQAEFQDSIAEPSGIMGVDTLNATPPNGLETCSKMIQYEEEDAVMVKTCVFIDWIQLKNLKLAGYTVAVFLLLLLLLSMTGIKFMDG